MASTVRSDVIIPEIFTPYLVEATTQRDAFLASGVVSPLEVLNATEGGDFVNIPNWKANLAGDFEVLTDSTSCLLYTSPSPRDLSTSRMPSSA